MTFFESLCPMLFHKFYLDFSGVQTRNSRGVEEKKAKFQKGRELGKVEFGGDGGRAF